MLSAEQQAQGIIGHVPPDAPAEPGVDVPALLGRQLPSARELAEFHTEGDLVHLRGVATSLGDTDAAELFAAAVTERRRIEVSRALAEPALVRRRQAEWEAMNEAKPQVGAIRAVDYQRILGNPVESVSAQSAGPSE